MLQSVQLVVMIDVAHGGAVFDEAEYGVFWNVEVAPEGGRCDGVERERICVFGPLELLLVQEELAAEQLWKETSE